MNFKAAKRKPNFKEIIAQVIQKKKEGIKKQRKKKLAQMMLGTNDEDNYDSDNEVEGLSKDQTAYIIDQL